MPNNTRGWAKKKIGEASGNLDKCGQHLEEIKQIYEKDHPEITVHFEVTQQMLIELIQYLDRVNDLI